MSFFVIQEFVPQDIFKRFGKNAWWFVDDRIVAGANFLRLLIGAPITINDWHTGGWYSESGLRSFSTSTGASMSQHRFGRAIDIKVEHMSPMEVYDFVKKNWAKLNPFFTTIESIEFTKTWVHLDCRHVVDRSVPFIVNP